MTREDLLRWGSALGMAVLTWIFGWLIRTIGLTWLAKLASRTRSDLDELVLDTVRPRIAFWFLLLGVVVAVRHGNPGPDLEALVDKAAVAAFLFSLTLALASLLSRLFESHAQRWSGTLPSTSLTRNAIRIVVIALGSLVVLGTLGIAIAPLLTALGVGSLAVALALQPTLSNLFAGFHITMARRIQVGDFVELEGGQQGYVEDIGWRSTQIRELPNNLILVPNAKLAEIIVKNYALPDAAGATLVQVGVAYGSDLEAVERITIDTARGVQRTVTGAVEDFEPFIRYHTFGDSSINFTVILRVKSFVDRYLVMHEFIKRLQRRYATDGIEIPFPQRVVHMPVEDLSQSERYTRMA